jgi:CHAT domain-containing protein
MNEESDDSEIPSKGELLVEMARVSKDKAMLLQKAELAKNSGDLDSAIRLNEELIAVGNEELRIALLHNQHYEYPIEIAYIVRPLLNAMLTLADLWEAKGNIQQTEKLQNEAREVSSKYLDPVGRADVERSLASSLISRGRFNEALVALSASRDVFAEKGAIVLLGRTTVDIVDLLQWLGDYARALSELAQASKIIAPLVSERVPTQEDVLASVLDAMKSIRSGEGYTTRAEDTMNLYRISTEIDYYKGLVNKALGNFEDAELLFGKVLPEYQKIGVGTAIEYQLASVLVKKGSYQEGLALASRLEPEFTKPGLLRHKLAALLCVQSEAQLNLGRFDEALSRLNEGIKDLSVYYDLDLLWKLQWLAGRTLEAMGQEQNALKSYAEAAETVNSLRKAPLGYRLDSTYIKDKLGLFEEAIVLACKSGLAKECCEFMEMVKSRALTTSLSISPESTPRSSSELEEKFDDLSRRLDSLEFSGYKNGMTDELKRNKEALLVERDTLFERIRFSDPHWRAMTKPVPFDFSKIASILSARELAALSLFYASKTITAVLIKDGKSSVASVEMPADVHSRLEDYAGNLQSADPNPLLYDLSNGLGVGAKHLIPEELLTQALQSRGLIIVPHGLLHLVPWAGLIFKGKRLFDYCPVGVLPNLGCMPSLEADFSVKPEVALVGAPDYSGLPSIPPLPYAEKEMGEIEQSYSSESKIIEPVLSSKRATATEFWRLLRNEDAKRGILHIVCHGTFEPDEPMNSGLLLADSKVDAAEISRSKLEYDEVVLSACSSGWRPTRVKDIELLGDDILGLPGAFLEAGVSSVLVSIPRADDRAAHRFMVLYHQNRLRGKSPLGALQETQKTMFSDQEYKPFTWIGFTVYGFQ